MEAHGSTDFSMAELSRVSGVAIQTLYNLFLSKTSIVFTLLNDTLDRIEIIAHPDLSFNHPMESVFFAADSAIDVYLDRPVFYTSLFKHLFGVDDNINRPKFNNRAQLYWTSAVEPLFRKWPDCEILKSELADDINLFFIGVLESWIHQELDATQFRAKIRRGIALRLLALNMPGTHDRLLMEISLTRSCLMRPCADIAE